MRVIQPADLITAFCSKPERRRLYEGLAKATNIILTPASEGAWSTRTANGTRTITYTPTDHPEACLAHELLHIQLQENGYRCYLTAVSFAPKHDWVLFLLSKLDNELQHHKLYPAFLRLGFGPEHMYYDNDRDTYRLIQKDIARFTSDSPVEFFLSAYVPTIAPGGAGTTQDRLAIENQLRAKASTQTWKTLMAIRKVIMEYRDSNTLDAARTIARIMQLLGQYEPTWIGHTKRFPDDGIFIGNPFTMEEARRALAGT